MIKLKKWGKRNKFHVAPRSERTHEGIVFASKREMQRYKALRTLEALGEIENLELQPKFPFIINGEPVKGDNGQILRYTADFSYVANGQYTVEDIKGVMTEASALRIKIAQALHGMKVIIVK